MNHEKWISEALLAAKMAADEGEIPIGTVVVWRNHKEVAMKWAMTFGRFFRQQRIGQGKTLRRFCLENGFDPVNLSKLERDRLPPPRDRGKLEAYASALGLKGGSDDWYAFFDLAIAAADRIPAALLSEQEALSRLPLVSRTPGGEQPNHDKLATLVELIRGA